MAFKNILKAIFFDLNSNLLYYSVFVLPLLKAASTASSVGANTFVETIRINLLFFLVLNLLKTVSEASSVGANTL